MNSTCESTLLRARIARGGAALCLLVFAGSGALPFACGAKPPPPAAAPEAPRDAGPPDVDTTPPTLYSRLGGKDGVAAIVDAFIEDLLADKRLKKAFSHTMKGPKLDHFKQMLEDQLCDMTGGGCHYTGKTMSDEHASMKVTDAQFDAFVQDFQLALEEKQVSKEDEQQVLDQLNLLKDQIVMGK